MATLIVLAAIRPLAWRTWRRLIWVLPVSAALVLTACGGGAGSPVLARQVSGQQPPPCSANPPQEALTGHRDSDWTAFAAVYHKVTSQLPASPAQRQELGAATMTAMVASLDNNHAE